METLLSIYFIIAFIFLLVTAILWVLGDEPEEITNIYSWLFYGLLFPIIITREFVKFINNVFNI
jgi:hypothetical protein